jgi:hypothetical protein
MAGSIVSIFIAPTAAAPMLSVDEARLEEGQGIVAACAQGLSQAAL